ncbi:molybdenum cofactor guanylyltransferase [Zhaonella formicivorans]|uniref:molybdenum cofactor guanylyltransferase n=1 Tax=Zhaonella formicivorans TaxID=2528593 RepID=UPI0010E3B6E2|nr:molybdenum cofactor guanylyltransferase [Zhaonella formicivorans]
MYGIVLAGGKSSRMKSNKSFLRLNGRTFIETIINVLKPIFKDNIIVITNEPELYSFLNVKLESDLFKDKGPLAGIYTGLMVSPSHHNFFIACDMPFVSDKAIRFIIEQKANWDAVVPVIGGYIEPLYGIYSKNCIEPIKDCLVKNWLKATSFYDQVAVKTIPETIFKKMDPELKMFININTPKEFGIAQNL